MHYLGVMLAILTVVTIAFAAHTLYRDYLGKARSATADVFDHSVAPVLPYLSFTSPELQAETTTGVKSFEELVTKKFDPHLFECLDKKNECRTEGVQSVIKTCPDLFFEYQHPSKGVRFAVKCEWRARFIDEAIYWAKSRQVDDYYTYLAGRQEPFFVVIGIGGSPGKPEQMYVIPLNKIHRRQLFLTTSFLEPYRSKPADSPFSFDPIALSLT